MSDAMRTLQKIMKNEDLNEFVALEDGIISEEDSTEAVELYNSGAHSKVDLIKLAHLYIQGYDTATLADLFNITQEYVNKIKRSPKFKAVISALNAEIVVTARTFLTASGFEAVKTLVDCMNSNDDRTRLKAATEVLDRIGLKAPEQIEIIQKGDKIRGMDEEQLLELVKLGMKDVMPKIKEGQDGDKSKTD